MPPFDFTRKTGASGKPAQPASPQMPVCHRDKQPCAGPACVKWAQAEDGAPGDGECLEVVADDARGRFYDTMSESLEALKAAAPMLRGLLAGSPFGGSSGGWPDDEDGDGDDASETGEGGTIDDLSELPPGEVIA